MLSAGNEDQYNTHDKNNSCPSCTGQYSYKSIYMHSSNLVNLDTEPFVKQWLPKTPGSILGFETAQPPFPVSSSIHTCWSFAGLFISWITSVCPTDHNIGEKVLPDV